MILLACPDCGCVYVQGYTKWDIKDDKPRHYCSACKQWNNEEDLILIEGSK